MATFHSKDGALVMAKAGLRVKDKGNKMNARLTYYINMQNRSFAQFYLSRFDPTLVKTVRKVDKQV